MEFLDMEKFTSILCLFVCQLLGGGDPSRRVSGAPPAPPAAPGVYRRDRPIQIVSLGNSYAPAPCPLSHLHAAAAVRAGSVPEITQGYKY